MFVVTLYGCIIRLSTILHVQLQHCGTGCQWILEMYCLLNILSLVMKTHLFQVAFTDN